MKVPVSIITYGVEGPDGQFEYQVSIESYDTVMFSMVDSTGERRYFESEAFHLVPWCREHGFKLYIGESNIFVELKLERWL